MTFPGVDYMLIDSLFSEDELMVRQTVRDFVDDEVLPIIEHANREEKFPVQLIPKMAEMGLFGATISEYGLPGLNNVAYGLIMQELERGDSGLRSFASVQSGLVMFPIYAYGSQEQKDYWIPKLAAGEKIGCFGLTEPDFGSNPGAMRTYARKDGDWYVARYVKLPPNEPIDVVGFRFNTDPASSPAIFPATYEGGFLSSDPLLTRIWYSAASTIQLLG